MKHCGVKVETETETEKTDSMKYKTFIPLNRTFKAFTPLKGDTKCPQYFTWLHRKHGLTVLVRLLQISPSDLSVGLK